MSLIVGYGDSFPNRTGAGRSLSGPHAFKPVYPHGPFGDSEYLGDRRTANGSRNGTGSAATAY